MDFARIHEFSTHFHSILEMYSYFLKTKIHSTSNKSPQNFLSVDFHIFPILLQNTIQPIRILRKRCLECFKAGTHEATNRCNTLLQQIALCVQSSDKSLRSLQRYRLLRQISWCACLV